MRYLTSEVSLSMDFEMLKGAYIIYLENNTIWELDISYPIMRKSPDGLQHGTIQLFLDFEDSMARNETQQQGMRDKN